MSRNDELKAMIRDVPGFPQEGIIFRDITPVLGDRKVFQEIVDLMSRHWLDKKIDRVAAIEARGFIPGAAIALRLGAGFIPIRKAGQLAWQVLSHSDQLEDRTDQLDIHHGAIAPGERVLIVDDVLAIGRTAGADAW